MKNSDTVFKEIQNSFDREFTETQPGQSLQNYIKEEETKEKMISKLLENKGFSLIIWEHVVQKLSYKSLIQIKEIIEKDSSLAELKNIVEKRIKYKRMRMFINICGFFILGVIFMVVIQRLC